ncbi:MAG: enoyl-CoA hydratase/isomerase family protein, partial [Pseudomonadota bacterium]
QLRQPVVAVLNGMALGGGLELAATADLRIAEPHARFGLPETRVGTIPGWSGTQRLVRRFGGPTVKRLALTGELVDAPKARDWGLVDEISEPGQAMAQARALAAQICERAPIAVELAKQLVNAAEGEDQGAALEGIASAVTRYTEDGAEGLASFRGKRAPLFHNR